MPKILICIPTYKRNNSLLECVKSIKKLNRFNKNKIGILILDNTTNNNSLKISKELKKTKLNIYHLNEKKRGIVNARNKCLQAANKFNPKYLAFIDDDVKLDKNWLTNNLLIINNYSADIVTGPQNYLKVKQNENLINYNELFEKKYNNKIKKVKWAATNNVFIRYKSIKLIPNLKFDKNLNKFGIGEDQLFFSTLSNLGLKILWSKKVKVFEKIYSHRNTSDWVKNRSSRLGILGHYIDIKLHGKILGYFLNYLKCFFYLFIFFLTIINPLAKVYKIKLLNSFFRFYGRLRGPFLFKKIGFYK